MRCTDQIKQRSSLFETLGINSPDIASFYFTWKKEEKAKWEGKKIMYTGRFFHLFFFFFFSPCSKAVLIYRSTRLNTPLCSAFKTPSMQSCAQHLEFAKKESQFPWSKGPDYLECVKMRKGKKVADDWWYQLKKKNAMACLIKKSKRRPRKRIRCYGFWVISLLRATKAIKAAPTPLPSLETPISTFFSPSGPIWGTSRKASRNMPSKLG